MKFKSTKKDIKSFEKDYKKIMKGHEASNFVVSHFDVQWLGQGDAFVKFSLYNETPNSISSTDTLTSSSLYA